MSGAHVMDFDECIYYGRSGDEMEDNDFKLEDIGTGGDHMKTLTLLTAARRQQQQQQEQQCLSVSMPTSRSGGPIDGFERLLEATPSTVVPRTLVSTGT
jgi:hypothetical protein